MSNGNPTEFRVVRVIFTVLIREFDITQNWSALIHAIECRLVFALPDSTSSPRSKTPLNRSNQFVLLVFLELGNMGDRSVRDTTNIAT